MGVVVRVGAEADRGAQFGGCGSVAGGGGCCHSECILNHYHLLHVGYFRFEGDNHQHCGAHFRFWPTDNHEAAESVDCQMVGANRVAQQLNVQTDGSQSCQGINKVAEQTAFGLMTKRSQDRYLQKARGWCFLDDSTVAGNIGPLFLDGSISLTETSDCLQVTSLALNTSLSSLIFKGEHYCKLLSPAMAMEWMMTDGLKPYPYHALSEVTI